MGQWDMHQPKNILLGNIFFFKDREQQRGGRDNNAGKLSTFGKPVLFKNLVKPSNMAHAMKGGKLSENYKDTFNVS